MTTNGRLEAGVPVWLRPATIAATGAACAASLGIAGTILLPPLGGLLAIAVTCLVLASVALLVRSPGWFLAVFFAFATVAPFLSRIAHLPLGWIKGTFFLAILPIWILTRITFPSHRADWISGARIPLLIYIGATAIFLALGVLSVLRGIPTLKVMETLKGHILYPPMIFMAMEAAGDRQSMRRFCRFVLALTGFVAAGAVVQSFVPIEALLRAGLSVETGSVVFIAIDPISGKIYQRLFSVLDDQSSVAAFSFLGIILSVYLLMSARRARHRAPLIAMLGLNAYALILTYNMTTLSGVILFFLLLVARMKSVRLLTWFLLVTLLVSGIAWVRYGEFIRNRLVTSFTLKEGVSTSLYIRVKSNKRAIRMVEENPILGQGLGATANAYVYYRLGMRRSIEGGFAVDNFYMTVLLESGILGLGALLMLHSLPLLGFRALRRNSSDRDDHALSVVGGTAVIAFLLMNFSNGQMNTNPTNLVFWSMTGAVWRRVWDSRPGGFRPLAPSSEGGAAVG